MSVRDNLKTQLEEMEMIKSIYFQPGEFREDRDSCAAVSAYVNEGYEFSVPPLVYTLNLIIDEVRLEVNVTLPTSYPNEKPNVYLRDNTTAGCLDIVTLNDKLKEYMHTLGNGEICIWQIIVWLQENAKDGYKQTKATKQRVTKKTLSRYWIYSHHIYSTKKRKDILDLASKNDLTGFILPGRPGIMCLEGYEEDCHNTWVEIKHMNWQKITVKKQETDCTLPRKFTTFEEVCFKGHSDRHMDMGKFLAFLKDCNSENIFKEYFGCDGQTNDNF